MSSIGILLTSRNNYDFMEKFWIPNVLGICDINCRVLNIDEDSKSPEKEKGKKLCDQYGISFMNREEKGMHHNILTAIDFFSTGVKYIIWFQHDCWPLQKDFFKQFNDLVENDSLQDFGTISFNSIAQNIFKHDDDHNKLLKDFKNGKNPLGCLARSNLESAGIGDIYYCGQQVKNRIKRPVPREKFLKPFACAVPNWYAIAVNVDLFKKHIDVNRGFHFFKSWDDISFQFLKHNVYNIILPCLYVEHRPDLKPSMGLPRLSTKKVKKGDCTFHSGIGSTPESWIDQWGWDFEKPSTFEKVKGRYKGTLLYDFYKYDYTKGPLKTFDI